MAHLLTAAGGADVGSRRVHSAKNVINDSLDANYYVSLGERGQAKRRIANVFCGGTIVTGSAVLTAAHCIADEERNARSSMAWMLHDLDRPGLRTKTREFGRARMPFEYQQRAWRNDDRKFDYDVGLVLIKKFWETPDIATLPVKHLENATVEAMVQALDGLRIYAVGMGTEQPGQRQILRWMEMRVMPGPPEDQEDYENLIFFRSWANDGSSLRQGDGGTGMIVFEDNRYKLVAVAVRRGRDDRHGEWFAGVMLLRHWQWLRRSTRGMIKLDTELRHSSRAPCLMRSSATLALFLRKILTVN